MPYPASQLRSQGQYGKSTTTELLYGILTGMKCLKYVQFSLTDTTIGLPAIPNDPTSAVVATKAVIVIEAGVGTTDTSKVARFMEDNNLPTPSIGMPLGSLDVYECGSMENIEAFRIIGIDAGVNHIVNVAYYG